MRLSKRQLKRIIREEYSRLKRRGLIKETAVWQMNHDVGGPEDQDCPEGTSIEQCAETWVEYVVDSFGVNALSDICDFVRPAKRGGGQDVIDMGRDESEAGYACSECLEGMDINGSGNWDRQAAADALADAFCSGATMDKYGV